MEYIFLFFLIALIAFVTIRGLKNKGFPSNNYTPFDDLVNGKTEDTNHHVHYQDSKKEIE